MTYRETFQVKSVSVSAVLNATLSAIDELGWEVTGGNSAGTFVTAKTGFSIWSSGESVSIAFREVASGVEVDARSSVRWQLFSWGRNAENVSRVRLCIERHLFLVPDQTAEPSEPPQAGVSDEHSGVRAPRVGGYCHNCGAALDLASPEGRASSAHDVKCRTCGESIAAEAKFCPCCGSEVLPVLF